MNLTTLRYEVRNHVAYVTFSNPDKLNSITEERLNDLNAVMDSVESDATIRALTITGEGRAFCVGDDLDLLKHMFADLDYFEGFLRRFGAVLSRLEQLEVPVIAAINGLARAGGFEISLSCDLVLIADDAKYGDVHLTFSVLPGGGASQRLPRRIGEQRAKELIWSGKWLNGPEAVEYGLALKSVPAEQLAAETEKLLDGLRDKPREALGIVKRTIHRARYLPISEGVNVEIEEFMNYTRNLPYAIDGFKASVAAVRGGK